MSERFEIPDEQLHALIDGELTAADSAELESVVAGNATLNRRVALFRADRARLAQIYNPVTEQPLPAHWIQMIQRQAPRPRPFYSIEAITGIAAAIILAIGGSLVYRESLPHEEPIVEEALAARDNALAARQTMALNETQAAAATRAISSALAMHVSAPNLHRMGYSLVGLRVYGNASNGKSVELLYRKPDQRTFALYLRHPSGAPRFDQYKQGKLRVCIWQDDVLGAVMTGEMSVVEMQRLASLAYSGLEA
jgi:anti-sigma factor RsiW